MVRSRLEVFQFALDVMILVFSLYLSSVIRIKLQVGTTGPVEAFEIPPVLYLIVLVVWLFIFVQNDVYIHKFGTKFRFRLLNLVKSHFIACFLYFGVLYLVLRDVSRLQSFYFIGFVLVGVVVSRILIRIIRIVFLEGEESKIRVLIAGTGENAAHVREKIRANPRTNLHFVGFVQLPFDDEAVSGISEEISAVSTNC